MLNLTSGARTVLQKFTRHPTLSPTAGLRIARSKKSEDRFHVEVVPEPQQDDKVIEDDGARVFLGPVAARRLGDHTLDARNDAQGRVEFVVRAAAC